MKTTVYKIHKWVGLALGVLLFLQAVTGLTMAHKEALMGLFGPQVEPAAPHRPLDDIVGVLKTTYPEGRLERLTYFRDQSLPVIARIYPRDSLVFQVAVVDPTRAKILSAGPYWQYPLVLMERVHVSLLAGETGHAILLTEALALVFMAISGLVVWWPRNRKFAKALVIHWKSAPLRLLRDIHVVPGAVMAVLMCVAGLTGAAIIADPLVKSAVSLVAPVAPESEGLHLAAPRSAAPEMSWQQAADQLRARFPDGRLRQFRFLAKDDRVLGAVMVATRAANPRAHHVGFVDRFNKDLVVTADGNALLSGDAFVEWMLPLHTGEAFGPLRPLLMTLLGLSLAGMTVTGFLMWVKKRRPARRAVPAAELSVGE